MSFSDKAIVSKAKLRAIKEKIQQHTGGEGGMTLDQMASAIEDELVAIPTGEMTITSDGEYDVTDCATVTVETGGSGSPLNFVFDESDLSLVIEEVGEWE